MLTTWDQRVRRDGIVLKRVQFPVPTTFDDLYERITTAITPRTKVLHFCHITNLTGQLFPVQRICRAARARGITTIVDGAHAGAALKAAIADALAFHRAVGAENKAARLYYLTMRWANRLRPHERIQMFSSLRPGETWGLATVGIRGIDASKIAAYLWDRRRIIVAGIASGTLPGPQFDYQGVRVTPNVYTSIDEVDAFAGAMEELLRQ